MGWSKIFRTDAVKIVKLTIRPIDCRHPQSISLLHVDTGPTISSIFWMVPGSPFLSVSSTLCDSACIPSVVSNRRPCSFNFSFQNRKKSQGAKSGEYGGWGIIAILFFTRNWWVRTEVWDGALFWWSSQVCFRQSWGDVFACFHAVAAKRRSRTQNSQFGLLGQIIYAQSPCIDGSTGPEYFGSHLVSHGCFVGIVQLHSS